MYHKRTSFSSGIRIISWLMCFGGGVFFGTYLMDMAPGVREILHYSLLKPNGITYPLPEFLIGGTLCFVKESSFSRHVRLVALDRVVGALDCYAEGLLSNLPLLKHMWGTASGCHTGCQNDTCPPQNV